MTAPKPTVEEMVAATFTDGYAAGRTANDACPWCGAAMERVAVDGGDELGCVSEKCPSFGIGVWCYADNLRAEIDALKQRIGELETLRVDELAGMAQELRNASERITELERLIRHRADGHLCAGYWCDDPKCPDCLAFQRIAELLANPAALGLTAPKEGSHGG